MTIFQDICVPFICYNWIIQFKTKNKLEKNDKHDSLELQRQQSLIWM